MVFPVALGSLLGSAAGWAAEGTGSPGVVPFVDDADDGARFGSVGFHAVSAWHSAQLLGCLPWWCLADWNSLTWQEMHPCGSPAASVGA